VPPLTAPPPLRWWNHLWRVVVVLLISGVAWFEVVPWQWQHARWWFWSDVALGLLSLMLVTWRRRHPVAVAGLTNALTFVSWTASGPATLALVSMATRRRWREIVPIGLLSLVAGVVIQYNQPQGAQSLAVTIPIVLLIIALTVGWGMYIGSRRELVATLRERAETAEIEQAARVSQARTAERSRIAREMHDVLAHRISLVTMHAGALAYRDDLSPDEVRTTAAIIQDNSHRAMVELREVLGILREGPGDSAPERPQPSAGDLAALIDEARQSGMRVHPTIAVEVDEIPEALGRTVYRVVQEGLTNARKHAADTLVTVTVAGGPDDGLSIGVRNPIRVGDLSSAAPRSGLGLAGLTERADLAGGRLTHHVSPGAEFVLEAWLPWPA
jgi:signal transduction histidine kinase